MTSTTRPTQYSHSEPALYVALELSSRTWKLGMTLGFGQKARERNVSAGNLVSLAQEIRLAKKRFGLRQGAPTYSCYEAGRDGFWIHRALVEMGWSTSLSIPRASRSHGASGAPRPTGWTSTSC